MSVFFVGGSQRSGTTLLQTLLCQHQSVNPLIREAKYFRHLLNAYNFGKQAFDHETRFYFESEHTYDQFNQKIIHQFLQQLAELFPSSEHLVLREPHLTMMFPALFDLMPSAKFLCIVRNPLDVIASMLVVGQKLSDKKVKDSMSELFLSRDMGAISQHFLSFYQPLLEAKNKDFLAQLKYVRYEDLVMNPKQTLLDLEAFTAIKLSDLKGNKKLDSGQIDYKKISRYSEAWKSPLYEQAVSNKRVNAYKEQLSDTEINRIKNECEAFMKVFDY